MRSVTLETSNGPAPLLWDVSETRRQLGGISRRTLERMELKPIKIGRRTFYRPDDVRDLVKRLAA